MSLVQDDQTQLGKIAADLFSQRGVDFAMAKKAGGWTNEVWMAGGLVLRLSKRQDSDRLRREMRLSSFLPLEVGYPAVVDVGVTGGFEWCMLKEITGSNLGDVWPSLDWDERRSIVRQIWQKAEAVHSVAVGAVSDIVGTEPWYNATDRKKTDASLSLFAQRHILSHEQSHVLWKILHDYWKHLPDAPCVLNHGDITTENIIYRSGSVVSLLDFEHATIAPIELDLCNCIKMVFEPDARDNTSPDSSCSGVKRLQDEVIDLALPVLDHTGSRQLLMGYAVLKEIRHFEDCLVYYGEDADFTQWRSYQRLASVGSGHGGYLGDFC
jgi:aminoglycoside phosphotransferase (APT) family kinase protein